MSAACPDPWCAGTDHDCGRPPGHHAGLRAASIFDQAIPAVRHQAQAIWLRAELTPRLRALPPPGDAGENFLHAETRIWLEVMIVTLDAIIAAQCPEDPMRWAGQPIGMYHCPRCSCVVVGGVPGHDHEPGCRLGLNPDRVMAVDIVEDLEN